MNPRHSPDPTRYSQNGHEQILDACGAHALARRMRGEVLESDGHAHHAQAGLIAAETQPGCHIAVVRGVSW